MSSFSTMCSVSTIGFWFVDALDLAPHLTWGVSIVRCSGRCGAHRDRRVMVLPWCGSGQTTVDLLPRCLCCFVRLPYYSRDYIRRFSPEGCVSSV
ncbi:hypothetical protein M758_1G140400 [Ceratodon purpureus]|nr:hypothetical protein M758_1G140400 [Ceratodon purpureus]